MMTLILPGDMLKGSAEDKIDAILHFASDMRRHNIPEAAFPPEITALARLKEWVGEVRSGGNGQFVGNKRERAAPMLESILHLLRASGATAHADTVQKVLHWTRSNPERAAEQSGFAGGLAPELQALDAEFWAAEQASPVLESVVEAMLARLDIRLLPLAEVANARQAEARRLIEESPEIQRSIVRSVAAACRAWLSDPLNMGMALASSKVGAGVFTSAGLQPVVLDDGTRKLLAVLNGWGNDGPTQNVGNVVFDQSGLRFTGNPDMDPVDVFVSAAEIRRATRMALAFRLPESVGLRWVRMGRPFSVIVYSFAVMPGSSWQPTKWRVMWIGDADWGVKGSPNRSTFSWGTGLLEKETLMQDEIAARLEALSLRPGS
jgi:hypothetical protein